MNFKEYFQDKRILITGGLGFIGSNLAIVLVRCGAKVLLVDAMLKGMGGNLFNIKPIEKDIDINYSDIRDENSMNVLVKDKDYIFHLAGQNDHVLSLSNPFPDIDINIKGSAILLEACKKNNPDVRLIYTGTRGEYGSAARLPVSEEDPINPKGIYELSSLTVQKMFRIYHDNFGIRSTTLRLTNIYGERSQMKHSRFGVANWFIRLALDNQTIPVFGDGDILRDFLYVEDTVEAILMCALNPKAEGEVFNIGHDHPQNFRQLAESIVQIAGCGRWGLAPFSKERLAQEPGDFYSDITKIRQYIEWSPKTKLEEGLGQTIAYYKENKAHYWS